MNPEKSSNKFEKNRTCFTDCFRYLFITLIFSFTISEYEELYMLWYNQNVMPIISQFKSDVFIWFIVVILLIYTNAIYCKRYKRDYVYDTKLTFGIAFVLFLLLRSRLSDDYEYVIWLRPITYVDIICFMGIEYIAAALINIYKHTCKIPNNDNNEKKSDSIILKDWPINTCEEDIFDLEDEAKKIVGDIICADKSKTWSFAITAPWGTGKTSFINMIIDQIKKSNDKDFDIVQFNPRDCKSYTSIQEEFFMQLACVLSKYNHRCNSIIKDYMASLQLIDNRGIVEKLSNFYRIWDKTELKKNIGKTFEALTRSLLVVIDDFDRLSKEEILEVLKLIDSNAAFNNLIFLTAYDKKQVNRTLGDAYKTEDACFVDKFFTLEFPIPARPYKYISDFVIDNLCQSIKADSSEKSLILDAINKNKAIIQNYIPTLRDAKRFINQVHMDYSRVRGDVYINEYILVELIKYRYPDELKKLYRKDYIEKGGFFLDNGLYYLKDLKETNIKCIDVLTLLFPKKDGSAGQYYRHIYESQSFDNYFVNQIYASLRIKDMKRIFQEPINKVYEMLDKWLTNGEETKDIIEYLDNLHMDEFNNGDVFRRYAFVVTYIAVKCPTSRAYWIFLRIIDINNLDGYDKKYNIEFRNYKESILHIILKKDIDPMLRLLRTLHKNIVTGKIDEEEELVKDNDIKYYLYESFIESTTSDFNEEELKSWLHDCVDTMESGTRRFILNKDCIDAYRKHIEASPSWYISHFVHLGGISSSQDWNSIACDVFWEQIFSSETNIESFIANCLGDNLEGAKTASNFWQLFKANNYKSIEFNGQGNVQEKIDNCLEDELEILKQIQSIQSTVAEIPESNDNLSEDIISEIQKTLKKCHEELNDIKLYISLYKKVLDEIKRKKALFNIED